MPINTINPHVKENSCIGAESDSKALVEFEAQMKVKNDKISELENQITEQSEEIFALEDVITSLKQKISQSGETQRQIMQQIESLKKQMASEREFFQGKVNRMCKNLKQILSQDACHQNHAHKCQFSKQVSKGSMDAALEYGDIDYLLVSANKRVEILTNLCIAVSAIN